MVAVVVGVAWSGATSTTASPSAAQAPAAQAPAAQAPAARAPGDAVLVGAGDIADCSVTEDSATAALIAATPGTVFALGDNAYPDGTVWDFANCYHPTWGAFKDRTRPVAGNHDYNTPGAAPYYSYFGAAAGVPGQGWYSFDVGTDWHVVVLNSNCTFVVGGCEAGSPQEQWLRADLAASTRACTVAMWHHPLFSSAQFAPDVSTRAFWRALYQDGAELVLTAHDHIYERYAAQDPAGEADPARGIRQFVVGTGGAELSKIATVQPNSQVRSATSFGVLKLSLRRGSYDWEFMPIPGSSLNDSGTGSCSGALSPATTPGAPQASEERTCLGRVATKVGSRSRVVGTTGDDVIVSGRATKVLAGAGNDLVCVTSSRGTRVAAAGGHDVIQGGPGPDRLMGNGDDDVIRGGGDADSISGGPGRDRLLGGAGSDSLRGSAGRDRLYGNGSGDILLGDGGRDAASGDQGRDRCVAERERSCER